MHEAELRQRLVKNSERSLMVKTVTISSSLVDLVSLPRPKSGSVQDVNMYTFIAEIGTAVERRRMTFSWSSGLRTGSAARTHCAALRSIWRSRSNPRPRPLRFIWRDKSKRCRTHVLHGHQTRCLTNHWQSKK